MKIVFTIVLALVVMVAALVLLALSSCMVSFPTHDNLIDLGVLALCSLGVIIGGIFLIARIHREY
jgi:hypothetical protein